MKPDTIVALASGAGRAGVAVIRVSGPSARDVLKGLPKAPSPGARKAELRTFLDRGGAPIDKGLALWFEAPASFTGEDVAEFHIHGGQAVIAAMLEACLGLAGGPAGDV